MVEINKHDLFEIVWQRIDCWDEASISTKLRNGGVLQDIVFIWMSSLNLEIWRTLKGVFDYLQQMISRYKS